MFSGRQFTTTQDLGNSFGTGGDSPTSTLNVSQAASDPASAPFSTVAGGGDGSDAGVSLTVTSAGSVDTFFSTLYTYLPRRRLQNQTRNSVGSSSTATMCLVSTFET